jgi:hypothetical protein
MEKTSGLQRFFYKVRYRRERYRQFIGITYMVLVSAAGDPKPILWTAGAIFVILGVAVRMWASGHIKKDKVLATDGPYAMPMCGIRFMWATFCWGSDLPSHPACGGVCRCSSS